MTVYANGFGGDAGPGWSRQDVATAPSGERFLGEFGAEAVAFDVPWSLDDSLGGLARVPVPAPETGSVAPALPPHTMVRVGFDLYVIRSWDGNADGGTPGPDVWGVGAGGSGVLLRTTFSNCFQRQAFPDGFPGGSHPPATAAAATSTLGYDQPCGPAVASDATYHLTFLLAHADPQLRLDFLAEGLQALSDESWGLDNVRVDVLLGAPA